MLSSLKPTETFMLSMKLAFFAGIVLAFPLLLMFVLQFVLFWQAVSPACLLKPFRPKYSDSLPILQEHLSSEPL